jgi:hypothetical protein
LRGKVLELLMAHEEDDTKLSGKTAAIVLLLMLVFSAPVVYMMSTPIGPAAWLIDLQFRLIDGYYPVATFVVLMGMELAAVMTPLYVVAIAVKRITGRTLVEKLRKTR